MFFRTTQSHWYLSGCVSGWFQGGSRHLKIRCAHLLLSNNGRSLCRWIGQSPPVSRWWLYVSETRRHPDASFHGRIIPTSSIAFFTSRGGVCEYPLCHNVCACWLSRSCCWVLRCSVSVCVFLCVPVLAYSQVYMNFHKKVKSNVVFSVIKRLDVSSSPLANLLTSSTTQYHLVNVAIHRCFAISLILCQSRVGNVRDLSQQHDVFGNVWACHSIYATFVLLRDTGGCHWR